MLDDLDSFDFTLAENLHMTVEYMQEHMSNQEYWKWRAFYVYKDEMRKMTN